MVRQSDLSVTYFIILSVLIENLFFVMFIRNYVWNLYSSEVLMMSFPVFSQLFVQTVGLATTKRKLHDALIGYEFYFLMLKTVFHSLVMLIHEILFLPLKKKIHIFVLPCNILYLILPHLKPLL